jgi:hypothetical protein
MLAAATPIGRRVRCPRRRFLHQLNRFGFFFLAHQLNKEPKLFLSYAYALSKSTLFSTRFPPCLNKYIITQSPKPRIMI